MQLSEKLADFGDVPPVLTWCEVAQGVVLDRARVTECNGSRDWWFELSYGGAGERVPGAMRAQMSQDRIPDAKTKTIRLF